MAAEPVASASTVLDHNDAYFTLEQLKIKDSEELKKYMEIMELRPSSFSKLRILEARKCDQELTKFLSILLHQLPGLEELILVNCKLLEQVLNLGHLAPYEQEPPLFSNLRKMKLWDLPKLSCIFNNDVKLANLVELQIVKCGFLKGPIPTTLLAKLDFLMIESCEMMEQVVEENAEMQESLFLNLRFLQLVNLPKLTKFNSAHCHWTFPKLEGVWIEKCPELNAFSEAVNMALLDTLKSLRLIGVPGILFLTLFNSRSLSEFSLRNLEEMEIVDCNDLQYVFAIEGLTTGKNREGGLFFPALRQLGLRNLGELRGIVKQDSLGRTLSFEMLTHLTVCSCNQLRYALPLHVLQSLGKLENIEISDCEMLERFFGDEDDTQMRNSDNIVHQLPQVKSLILEKLPKFSGCCQDGCTVEWLWLMRVRVVECPMIQKSSLGKIDTYLLKSVEVIECNTWANNEDPESHIEYLFELTDELSKHGKSKIEDSEELTKCMEIMELRPFIFSRLKILEARQCDQELTKFLSILLRGSHGLKELKVENCKLLEQVFDLEDFFNLEDLAPAKQVPRILFPNLKRMRLWGLPMLNCISNNDVKIGNLVHLVIFKCGFLKGPLPTTLLAKLSVLKIQSCEMLEQVIEENAEMQERLFPNLRLLVLVSLPKLTKFNSARCHLTFPKLEDVWIEKCPELNAFSQAVNTALLDTLKRLRLISVPGILFLTLSNSGSSSEFSLRNLKLTEIKDCNDLQYVFAIEGLTTGENKEIGLLFPALRQLGLRNLGELRGIVKQDSLGRTLSFEMLTHLTVCSCNQLRYALPLHVLQSLGKLENIEISDCEMLERVFGDEDDTQMRNSDNIVHQLPQVKSLILEKLPKFSGCCQDGCTVEWLWLNRVRVVECPLIQKSSLGKIDTYLLKSVEVIECNTLENNEDPESHIEYLFELTDELSRREKLKIEDSKELMKCMEIMELRPFIFSRLMILEARQCDQELTKFLSILLHRSHGLEELTVENCKLLEQVFNLEYLAPDKQVPHILFPNLKTMRLWDLPMLTCICNNDVKLGNLVQLEIFKCGFLKGPLPTTLLATLNVLKIQSCEMIEQVIEENAEMQERLFPNLQFLVLVSLPKLTKFNSARCHLTFPKLEGVWIEKCPELNAFSQAVNTALLDTLKRLRLIGVPGILFLTLSNSGSLSEFSLRNLELIEIKDCNDLQYVFAIEGLTTGENKEGGLLFPALRQLGLRNLGDLRGIVKQDSLGRTLSFAMLTHLTFCGCNQLRYALPLHVLQSLGKLENIEISDCEMLERFFGDEDDTQMRNSDNIVHQLPQVKSLILEKLPKFSGCCQDGSTVEWLWLNRVRVVECPLIQKSSLGKIDTYLLKSVEVIECNIWANNEDPESHIEYLFELTDELSRYGKLKIEDSEELTKCMEIMGFRPFIFSRLKILEARQCNQELTKFLSISLRQSHGLEELTVENCKLLEQLFNLEDLAPDKQIPHILFPNLKRMRLCGLPTLNCIWNNDPRGIVELGKLVKLEIIECGLRRSLLSIALAKELVLLEELKIESCEMIEHVIEDNTEMQENSFLRLKHLKLASLPELIKFTSSHSNFRFPNLRSLRIEICPKLKTFTDLEGLLLPFSYPELTEIHISDCQSLKDIFIDTGIKAHEKCFPNLESIVLENLPVLSSFSLEAVRFPKLQRARLVNCPEIKTVSRNFSAKTSNFMDKDYIQAVSVAFGQGKTMLPPQLQVLELSNLPKMQLWNQEPQIPVLEKMTSLKIIGCGSIEKLFSISVAKHLSSLKLLTLYKCENMVQVLHQGGRETGKQVFKKLETLVLKHLPRLVSFCEEDVDFGEFPQLKMIRVEDIPNMNTFVKQPLKTPKLKQVHVTFIRKCWLGNLNKTITFLHEIQDQLKEKVWESNQSSNTSYEAESSSQGKLEI